VRRSAPRFHQMRGIGVPERVRRDPFVDARLSRGEAHGLPDHLRGDRGIGTPPVARSRSWLAKRASSEFRDIDSHRMVLSVEQGKGGRDREIPLSPTLLAALRQYYRWMRPKTYLFPGEVFSPDYSRVVAKVVTLLDALLVWDSVARTWIVAHHHPVIDVLMVGLSIMGRAGTVWLAITLVLIILDRRHLRAVGRVVVALLLAYAVTDGLIKPLVARTRPFESPTATRVIDRRPATYSFPSGHAAASVAAALTLTRMWPRGGPVLWLLALLVSFSRIYVGVHYPLDVIGGALVGLACAWAAGRLILPRSG
jgi:undecaprenyl-diphosphatase